MDASLTRTVACRRYRDGVLTGTTDAVAIEARVRLRLEGHGERELFAAPIDPVALALGHAALDMLPPGQVPVVRRAEGLCVDLGVAPDTRPAADPALPGRFAAAEVLGLVTRFISAPGLWDGTGCFHRAGLYDPVAGDFLARAEDIGRHNCLDRLAGQAVRQGIVLSERVLFLSCRVTASMMEKALRAGFRLVVSRSAVTAAAVEAALDAGVTLVGFARDAEARFTVFADVAGRVAA
ncbi:MAG: formate dehydrogenase accessory sulfurtransferase FdhD [Solidesulfovibrio sp.]|uniref:formate dehydrogenase accessory sulfurtransferase FdhD n=1 Tax=Solidesulfovibrio sp. TaxID=2910990 RepID=UPI002B1EC51B|nr:formate dehydrogenase accessory sulfurtransferase FdhD [Solidesulfovibrio sp.]MEA4856184.1 formate dehydrogenase accessory sulfurtransferase FdhD [Solidesulfovibrio sp.]